MSSLSLDIPVIGIVRGISKNFFLELVQEAFRSGLQAIEVTLNTDDCLEMITSARKFVSGKQLLGVGTVCKVIDARRAIDAGAMFLVAPHYNKDVIHYATSRNIPIIAGALSPTEIYNAWDQGATMIKVFPCQAMGGPQYIRELRGPYSTVPLVAVGGVNKENVADYFAAGATGVGVAGGLFGGAEFQRKKLTEIGMNIREFLALLPDKGKNAGSGKD
jgi:2-dehydro-3-deoxyphosphogluconate aldolase/(4S)-4-hydroxy-2-oxoglutarate aldolase